mmetsp:Transcript_28893/g.41392  ORF Transcript_28893/g.41392 Transcript_28893/m.41392 type:complete len:102 (+) Transcript_28893:2348-2653(+)
MHGLWKLDFELGLAVELLPSFSRCVGRRLRFFRTRLVEPVEFISPPDFQNWQLVDIVERGHLCRLPDFLTVISSSQPPVLFPIATLPTPVFHSAYNRFWNF